jgi:hypothetical protein
MTIYINEKQLTLFEGAVLDDALLMYDNNALINVASQKAEALDAYGNHIALGGALHSGMRLFYRLLYDRV